MNKEATAPKRRGAGGEPGCARQLGGSRRVSCPEADLRQGVGCRDTCLEEQQRNEEGTQGWGKPAEDGPTGR